jgi:hypothetical protein
MTEIRSKPFMPPSRDAIRRAGIDALMRTATAHLVALVEGGRPGQIAERDFPDDRDVALLIKGAVVPTSTTNASALAHLTTHLVASLSGAWAAPTLFAQGLQLSFDGATAISVPGFVADASKAGFVKEGAPIPVRSRLVTPCELLPYNIKTISTLTVEMATSSNAQPMIEDLLKQDLGLAFDSATFDANAAVSETRPAGLRNGIAAITPASTATPAISAMLADVGTVIGAVSAVSGNTPPILVAAPARAATLRLFGGDGIRSMTILASSAIAPADLIAVAPNAIVSATDSIPEISAAFETALHMDDAPTNITTGPPPTSAAPVVAMYQTGALALKCRMLASWQRRDDRAVAWLSATGW